MEPVLLQPKGDEMTSDVLAKAKQAKQISSFLNSCHTIQKNNGLLAMANMLHNNHHSIIQANQIDVTLAKAENTPEALIDRLSLTPSRIEDMVEGLEAIAKLPDPIGEIIEGTSRPNGLIIQKKRVPIGVIAVIYEARPNVTVDVAGLTLKTSNACILRGSSSALNSNKALISLMNEALASKGFPKNTLSLIENTERSSVNEIVTCREYIDLVIPRGGAGLIQTVVTTATVPCIETGIGNCHVYIDKDAQASIILPIVINSKVQRPSVCNSAESLLIHESRIQELPAILSALKQYNVALYGCQKTQALDKSVLPATDKEYATEFLDYAISIKVVSSVEEAVEHITKFGSKHTEAILSNNLETIRYFEQHVDAAAIMINTSTRFTDGYEFGFGAEIGISTQKMHARGPMGLKELTTYKYIVEGQGQIRE